MVLKPLPFSLAEFQVQTAAHVMLSQSIIMGADTGTGKTVMSVVGMSLLIEDGLIDHIILEVEPSKLEEWVTDLSLYTDIQVQRYDRPRAKRAAIRSSLPQLLVAPYETFRGDIAIKAKDEPPEGRPRAARGRQGTPTARVSPGPLLEALRGSRVLMVQDEGTAKMGAQRGSWLYEAHRLMRRELGKAAVYRHWVLSATPMTRDPVGYFNTARLLAPEIAGTVSDFERNYVSEVDRFGVPTAFKNLAVSSTPGVPSLQEKLSPLVVYRSKSEPEIAKFFPRKEPMPFASPGYTFVDPSPMDLEFWEALRGQYGSKDNDDALTLLLRQVIGHPMSMLRSAGTMAADIVNIVGEKGLRALPTTKLDALVALLGSIGSHQSVVFTYFGQSVLPLVQERLVEEGYSVVINHGLLSSSQRARSREAFLAGDAQVYLSSDAGSRGVNLPSGKWAIDYDVALTDEVARQRRDRIDRMNSRHDVIHFTSMVMRNSIEMGLAALCAKRQGWAEQLGSYDSSGLTADRRKAVLAANRTVSVRV